MGNHQPNIIYTYTHRHIDKRQETRNKIRDRQDNTSLPRRRRIGHLGRSHIWRHHQRPRASRQSRTFFLSLDDFRLVLDQRTAGTAGSPHAVRPHVPGDTVCFTGSGVLDSRQEPYLGQFHSFCRGYGTEDMDRDRGVKERRDIH